MSHRTNDAITIDEKTDIEEPRYKLIDGTFSLFGDSNGSFQIAHQWV